MGGGTLVEVYARTESPGLGSAKLAKLAQVIIRNISENCLVQLQSEAGDGGSWIKLDTLQESCI